MKIAQIPSIFGTVAPPPGAPTDFGLFIAKAINLFIIVLGLFMLFYLMWGAFDWVSSSGEKERMEKARNKITQAIIGMIMAIVLLSIFNVIAGSVLHIADTSSGSWIFFLPKLGGP